MQPYKGYFIARTGTLAAVFWCRAALAQSWKSRAFGFRGSPLGIKELAEWFGLEVARLWWMNAWPSERSEWQNMCAAPAHGVTAI
jgi:hypothetical protein